MGTELFPLVSVHVASRRDPVSPRLVATPPGFHSFRPGAALGIAWAMRGAPVYGFQSTELVGDRVQLAAVLGQRLGATSIVSIDGQHGARNCGNVLLGAIDAPGDLLRARRTARRIAFAMASRAQINLSGMRGGRWRAWLAGGQLHMRSTRGSVFREGSRLQRQRF